MKLPDGINKAVLNDVCTAAANVAVEKLADCALMPREMLKFHYAIIVEAAIVAYVKQTNNLQETLTR